MSHSAVVVIILVVLLFAFYPRAGAYNANWGYYPMGGVGVLLVVLVVLLLLGII